MSKMIWKNFILVITQIITICFYFICISTVDKIISEKVKNTDSNGSNNFKVLTNTIILIHLFTCVSLVVVGTVHLSMDNGYIDIQKGAYWNEVYVCSHGVHLNGRQHTYEMQCNFALKLDSSSNYNWVISDLSAATCLTGALLLLIQLACLLGNMAAKSKRPLVVRTWLNDKHLGEVPSGETGDFAERNEDIPIKEIEDCL